MEHNRETALKQQQWLSSEAVATGRGREAKISGLYLDGVGLYDRVFKDLVTEHNLLGLLPHVAPWHMQTGS